MYSLFVKEIRSFLSSLIGYIVIVVFLLAISLFMWIIKGESNVLDSGYANIDTLFAIAPWVFLFLIPAITMRSFADEKKSGTIELLLTRPLTDLQIILAKYFAGFILVLISLLPTLLYYYSVYTLGSPHGNIDSGGTWGSYVGLLFLGSSFVAIGIFASSLTDNQIISFILSLALCFFCYTGFEQISSLSLFGKADTFIQALGINQHYNSLARGVIDTRDVVYFFSFNAFFVILTKTVLESRKWEKQK
jgi:ABC-2 type transport system permease protein